MDGKYNCGVQDATKTPLRQGWLASQCSCEAQAMSDSCALMSRAPFPMNVIGTNPPLCKLQEGHFWNRWKSCDPSTCVPTKCYSHRSQRVPKVETDHIENVEAFTV